jgi:hypothetical protein
VTWLPDGATDAGLAVMAMTIFIRLMEAGTRTTSAAGLYYYGNDAATGARVAGGSLQRFLGPDDGHLPLKEVAVVHEARREAVHGVLHKICGACMARASAGAPLQSRPPPKGLTCQLPLQKERRVVRHSVRAGRSGREASCTGTSVGKRCFAYQLSENPGTSFLNDRPGLF